MKSALQKVKTDEILEAFLKNMRKRREVTRDGTEQEESINKVILTGGPVLLEGTKEEESKGRF